jgi:hypothetical protein
MLIMQLEEPVTAAYKLYKKAIEYGCRIAIYSVIVAVFFFERF